LRSAVGDRRFEAAFAEGAAYSLDQAVTLALGQAPHAGAPSPTTVSDAPAAIREVGLTRREWEVAQLLAVGLSNKDIAARLVVSLRTAETHVEHILSKLGFNSRTQVGKWVMDQRAPESNT
jgi:DNA-binding NarL/FixJ family response regulator